MGVMEIVLILLGVVIFIVSFLIPAGKKEDVQYDAGLSEDAVREMVEKEAGNVKSTVSDMVDETITYAIEKSERAMERLTNEKIMAVNEYSDTVLEEINKNHKEVVFLYDMLNDKHDTLMATVSEAMKKESEVRQTLTDAEVTAKEAEAKAKEIQGALDKAVDNTKKAIEAAASLDKVTFESAPKMAAEPVQVEKEQDTDEFKPISAEKLEVIHQPPEEKAEEKEVAKTSGRGRRKSKVSKAALKDILPEGVLAKEETAPALETEATAAPEVASKESENPDARNSNEKILELHKAGKSNMTIAKELGLGVGEVKLVIDLYEGN
ncbi:DUF6115 domain-containing protein [Parablautia muri]|uniref:Uncharacterized protein n=1 Tax=Parablautia muri TaxID=2320879 RepID=A0A9X5BGL0_9FIRM|nr:DUF6115 domain-containing protein [Parablautia muri]NBJ93485.1 hypothetical protein [Parablautia muri]